MVYRVDLEKNRNTLLLQYNIKDGFHSKRYYYLSFDNPAIYRIKNIDDFLQYCQSNNINIVELDLNDKLRRDILTLIGVLDINNQEIKDNHDFYGSLATDFNDYDYTLFSNAAKENEILNPSIKNNGGKH